MGQKRTMYEKIWDNHVVVAGEGGKPDILYIDLHLVHEVTSPQAFEGLRLSGRKVRRPDLTFATMDHNVPTKDRHNIEDPISRQQIETLARNCKDFGIKLFDLYAPEQGIVHVLGPELGLTQPGKTIVCGDSHTSTHGAFGALAFGIGTSEVEHVLATQCLQQAKSKTMEVRFVGKRPPGVTAKDMILGLIAKYGTDFATGYVVEYTGEPIRELSMEERMTICNMSIEAGARAGLIAPVAARPSLRAEGRRFRPRRGILEIHRHRRGRGVRPRRGAGRLDPQTPGHLGHQSGHGGRHRFRRARSGQLPDGKRAQGGGAGPGIHGPETGHADE